MSKTLLKLSAALLLLYSVEGVTNYKSSGGGFQPNFYRNVDQVADATGKADHLERHDPSDDNENSLGPNEHRTQRFGITAYGGSGVQGAYPSTSAAGLYGPVKIDLGGVLLGSLIGLGAVLVLPKLVQAFSYSYGGGYGRSVEADMTSFAALLTKVDEVLEKNNVDSSSCAQRIACSYVQSSLDNMSTGNATEVDRFISSMAGNALVEYMLDGTSIRQALEAGKNINTNCQSLYPRCQLDKQTLLKIMTNALPS